MADKDPNRVWYRPPRGKKVPIDPQGAPGLYFPAKGDWTPRSNFLERMVLRGDGKFFDQEPGTEAGDDEEVEKAPLRPERKALDRETGVQEAKARLGFNRDKAAPGQTEQAGDTAAKAKS